MCTAFLPCLQFHRDSRRDSDQTVIPFVRVGTSKGCSFRWRTGNSGSNLIAHDAFKYVTLRSVLSLSKDASRSVFLNDSFLSSTRLRTPLCRQRDRTISSSINVMLRSAGGASRSIFLYGASRVVSEDQLSFSQDVLKLCNVPC